MNAPKRKGTAFETAVKNYLNDEGVYAYRNAPAGNQDKGDLSVPDWDAVIECKATKSHDLAGGTLEAKIEASHAKARFGIAVFKRRMANVSKSYVVVELEQFVEMMQRP